MFPGREAFLNHNVKDAISTCVVDVKVSESLHLFPAPSLSHRMQSADESLDLETKEDHHLDISSSGITISADTVYGALRGLETLSQLVDEATVPTTSITYVVHEF